MSVDPVTEALDLIAASFAASDIEHQGGVVDFYQAWLSCQNDAARQTLRDFERAVERQRQELAGELAGLWAGTRDGA